MEIDRDRMDIIQMCSEKEKQCNRYQEDYGEMSRDESSEKADHRPNKKVIAKGYGNVWSIDEESVI